MQGKFRARRQAKLWIYGNTLGCLTIASFALLERRASAKGFKQTILRVYAIRPNLVWRLTCSSYCGRSIFARGFAEVAPFSANTIARSGIIAQNMPCQVVEACHDHLRASEIRPDCAAQNGVALCFCEHTGFPSVDTQRGSVLGVGTRDQSPCTWLTKMVGHDLPYLRAARS